MAEPPRVGPGDRNSGYGRRQAPGQSDRGNRPKGGGGRRFLGAALRIGLLVFLWAVIIGGGALAYFALTLPDTNQLTVAERRPSVTILAGDGSIIATFG